MTPGAPLNRDIRHFHIFCGLGGGAAGFNDARPEVGPLRGRMRCIGGVDVDRAGIADFERLTGVRGTVLDLFDREGYVAFHGREPPPGWREATPDDIRHAAGGERPHIVFFSAPCKGFSGLLSQSRSGDAKYVALNRLMERGLFLVLTAWADDPPELIISENVPRIATRGRSLVDRVCRTLRGHGYATAETRHDCGVIGGLGQSRDRWLLVARHVEKVPPFLYEPPRRRLLGVGEVLEKLPLPGDLTVGGPMHRIPELQWRTWVRLAFVEAGKDWRSLQRLNVADGVLTDYRLVPEPMHGGGLGVNRWDEPAGVVAGCSRVGNGAYAVADPRREEARAAFGQYGVKPWDEPSQTVIGKAAVGAGNFAVADPRLAGPDRFATQLGVVPWTDAAGTVTGARNGNGQCVADPRHGGPAKHSNEFRVVRWEEPGRAVTGAHGSGQCVADPRPPEGRYPSKYRVTRVDEPAGTVISASGTGDGAFAIADPRRAGQHAAFTSYGVRRWDEPAGTVTGEARPNTGSFTVADPRNGMVREPGSAYASAGHYGVVPWDEPSGAVTARAHHDRGKGNVADPRALPASDARLACLIVAEDGTWHRPFTTLELAALQSLFDVETYAATGVPFLLEGESDTAWRERIGNAVPRRAARAIGETMGRTLLLSWAGESFMLSDVPIWVRPVAVALTLPPTEAPDAP